LSSQSAGPKILWIKNNQPDLYQRTDKFLAGTSYLLHRLTGEFVLDHYTAAAFSPLYDINEREWSAEFMSAVTERERLPDLAYSHEVSGTVHREASDETALARETPVVTGTADALSESISVGVTKPGEMMVMYGSSTFFIQVVNERPQSRDLWPTLHAVPDRYSITGGTATAGSLTRWFVDQLHTETDSSKSLDESYSRLSDLAAARPPGSNGLITLPYFSGERTPIHDPKARGTFFGLTLNHTPGDLYRSILEGVGYSIRHNMEAMESIGVMPERVVAVGGGTKSETWLQVVSDITNQVQKVPQIQQGASYGDAFLAGLGIDMFDELDDVRSWVSYTEIVNPREQHRALYDQYYELFRTLYQQTSSTMHAIHQIQESGDEYE